MAAARHFTDLVCWQLATELKRRLYELAGRRAIREDIRYRSQLRNAAASAPRNIAEGFGRYRPLDFAHYLDFARASLDECENHLLDAVDSGYITKAECNEVLVLQKRTMGAVAALQRYLRGRSRLSRT